MVKEKTYKQRIKGMTEIERVELLEREMPEFFDLIVNNQKMISNIINAYEKREKQIVKEFERIEKRLLKLNKK